MLDGCEPWPDDLAERYRATGYWQGRLLDELLRDQTKCNPDKVALVAGDRRFTYAELDLRADRLASGLRGLGLERGDRVVVQLPNIDAFVVLFFALLRIGAVPVLALPAHRESEVPYLCELSQAKAYVIPGKHGGYDFRTLARVVREQAPMVEHVLVAGDDPAEFTALADLDGEPARHPLPDPGEVAVFLLSGGTTGKPKLIPRTHDDYFYNVRASAQVCGFDNDTVYLVVLPVAHNFALACPGVLGVFYSGGTVVLSPTPSPEDAFPLIEREGVTVTAAVPPIALLWMEAVQWDDADLSSMRLIQVGGAKLAEERAAQVPDRLGCALQQVFGMAEGLLNYTRLDDPPELVNTTQGRPMSPADEIRVVDADGDDVAPGEVGELLTRGPYTLRGYYRAAEHNARSFTPDGFYRTGDLVRQLPTGHLIVEGREKDQINRGGDKISAEELENHILAHPAVHDVAVVGMPDPVLGEKTCAFLVPRGDAPTLRELKSFLRERGVAAYKLPDRVEITDAFPRTSVGKISKKILAERLTAVG